jgi:hypothetical protein
MTSSLRALLMAGAASRPCRSDPRPCRGRARRSDRRRGREPGGRRGRHRRAHPHLGRDRPGHEPARDAAVGDDPQPGPDPRLRPDQRQRPAGPGDRRQCREGRDRPHLLQLARLRHHQLPGRRHRPAADLGHPVRRPGHRAVRPGRGGARRQQHDDRHRQPLGHRQLRAQAPDRHLQGQRRPAVRLVGRLPPGSRRLGSAERRGHGARPADLRQRGQGFVPRPLPRQPERLFGPAGLGRHAQADRHRRLFAAGQPLARRAVGRPAAELFGRHESTIRARPRPRPTGPTGTSRTRPPSPSWTTGSTTAGRSRPRAPTSASTRRPSCSTPTTTPTRSPAWA